MECYHRHSPRIHARRKLLLLYDDMQSAQTVSYPFSSKEPKFVVQAMFAWQATDRLMNWAWDHEIIEGQGM